MSGEQWTCAVCGYPVSRKGQGYKRLRRPDGGFDHTKCALGVTPQEMADQRNLETLLQAREHRLAVRQARRREEVL